MASKGYTSFNGSERRLTRLDEQDHHPILEIHLFMADAATEVKLRFLLASGHLCSATAPATSAELMLQHHTEIAGTARLTSSQGSSLSCKACGTVLIPGWTSQLSKVEKGPSRILNPKSRSKKHTRGQRSAHPEKYARVKCLACHRFEDTRIQKTKNSRNKESEKSTLLTTSPLNAISKLDPDSSPTEKSTKASRRRERARQHKSGLQAMLDKSRAPAATTFGLGRDLMDLMTEG